uniref:Uncharacterized protein n=1 Tax=Strongyloides stercoralis TaxID=6248 RepID=A0A0K0DWY4_STRER
MKSIPRSISQSSHNFINSQYKHKKLVNIIENGTDFVIIRNGNYNSSLLFKERFENFLNFIKKKFYNFLHSNEKSLVKLIIYLLTIWVSAAVIIYLFESSEDGIYKNEENIKQIENVLRMINKIEKIHNKKLYDNKKWENEVVKLLIDEENKLYGKRKDITFINYYISWHCKMIGLTGKLTKYPLYERKYK